jgi:hypothetical protein
VRPSIKKIIGKSFGTQTAARTKDSRVKSQEKKNLGLDLNPRLLVSKFKV